MILGSINFIKYYFSSNFKGFKINSIEFVLHFPLLIMYSEIIEVFLIELISSNKIYFDHPSFIVLKFPSDVKSIFGYNVGGFVL